MNALRGAGVGGGATVGGGIGVLVGVILGGGATIVEHVSPTGVPIRSFLSPVVLRA